VRDATSEACEGTSIDLLEACTGRGGSGSNAPCNAREKGALIRLTALPPHCENGPKLDLQRPPRIEMISPLYTGGRGIVVLDEKRRL
jgi:hypothetical protein